MEEILAGESVVIVLAAGRGERMGGPKALMRVGAEPGEPAELWWRVQARRLGAAGFEGKRVIWVVSQRVGDGMHAETIGPAPERAVVVDSHAPMFGSVIAGFREAASGGVGVARPRGVFVLPIDVPAPSRAVFDRLQSTIVGIPVHAGVRGHPVWLSWAFAQEHVLSSSLGPGGRLDEVIRPFATEIDVDDRAVGMNLNTPEDVRAWRSSSESGQD